MHAHACISYRLAFEVVEKEIPYSKVIEFIKQYVPSALAFSLVWFGLLLVYPPFLFFYFLFTDLFAMIDFMP